MLEHGLNSLIKVFHGNLITSHEPRCSDRTVSTLPSGMRSSGRVHDWPRRTLQPRLHVCALAAAGLWLMAPGGAAAPRPAARPGEPHCGRWVAEGADPELWSRVRGVLKAELDPDASAPPLYTPLRFKYVAHVAESHGVVLVLVGMRAEKEDPPEGDVFRAFSLDLRGASGRSLSPPEFMRWRFLRWATFQPDGTCDAVFLFDSCWECEAEHLLGSFVFNAGTRTWSLRVWPEVGTSIMIGADTEIGGEEDDWDTTCCWSVGDHTLDGRDDVAVWCRKTGVETRRRKWEEAVVYTVSAAAPEKRVLGGAERRSVERALCHRRQNRRNELCNRPPG